MHDRSEVINAAFGDLALDLKRLTYQQSGAKTNLDLAGVVILDGGEGHVPQNADRPAADLSLKGLRLDLGEITLASDEKSPQWRTGLNLRLGVLIFDIGNGDIAAIRLGDFVLDDFVASSRPEYGLERLTMGALQAAVTRKPAPSGQGPGASATSQPTASPAPAGGHKGGWPAAAENLPLIRIGGFGLPNGGKIVVRDDTVNPPFVATIDIERLALFNVDSGKAKQPADLQLRARIAEATSEGRIDVQGSAALFKDKPDFDLTARIEDFGLPMLSPYVGPATGVDVASGTLGANLAGRAKAGQLDSEVSLVVRDLRFADRSDASADKIAAAIGVPLSTLVELLEDPDGTIDLTVPVKGDITSPDFDYSTVIWPALVRVLRAAIVAPFKLVSASFSLLGATGSDGAASPVLAPVAFAPGGEELSLDARGAIASVGQLLKSRPKMRLSLCGIAVGADFDAAAGQTKEEARAAAMKQLAPELRLLAQNRMLTVSRAIVAEGKVEAAQIRLCNDPRFDPADTGAPRVEVGF